MELTEESLRTALQEENRRSSSLHPVLSSKGFVVQDIIGHGAYSCVKKAYDTERKKYVAIKIISKRTANENLISKFIPREIEIIREVRHNNIIRFYDFIETTMRIYIVMQCAEAGSLLQLLKKQKTLPEWKAWRYFGQLADALEYVHGRGIAHRDIKCENIVLDENDSLKLIDFGFACYVRKATNKSDEAPTTPYLSRTFCGSHAYASPELLKFRAYQPQPCDVWATGVVLYIMLFGRTPFSNSKNVTILLEFIAKGLRFPVGFNVNTELEQLLKQIFAPVEARINITQIRSATWMQKSPRKTTSTECVEKSAAPTEVSDLKRKKMDQTNKT